MQTTQPKRLQFVRTLREHLAAHRDDEALQASSNLPTKLRSDPEILFLRALAFERKQLWQQAIASATQAVQALEHPDPMLVLARCYRVGGETEKCLSWCDRAAKLRPGWDIIDYIRGGALEAAGRFDEAKAILAPHVEACERSGAELPIGLRIEWAKLLVQDKRYAEAIALIDGLLELVPDQVRNTLLHLRAKACDRAKDFAAAWVSAERANEIGRLEFDPELYEKQVSTLIEIWSAENMARFPLAACDSEMPVFVAGMPRSGTSLIDQIIDAHPKAAGVGELASIERFAMELSQAYDPSKEPPACFGKFDAYRWTRTARDYVKHIEKVSPPGVERVVNKALGNNKLVGLIARLFPKTRIIHAIRDPRDVAISCFMGGFNNRLHPWTTRAEWAAKAWEQSLRMMEHWKATLDVPILDVHYERLVADPDTEFPRIIEFLGLEWDDRCFEFHKSRRTVRTLSYDQVNRPLYKTSSGRHRNYEEQIRGIGFPPYEP